jgi:hypothetical protein
MKKNADAMATRKHSTHETTVVSFSNFILAKEIQIFEVKQG